MLLDILLVDYINKDESNFEKRFNLKYREELIRIRLLDEQMAKKLFFGINDLSIPQSQFLSLNIPCKRVFVFENHTNFSNIYNFLTLPYLTESIAIFGKGFQIGLLKHAKWLSDKQIIYWGDIDAHGFQILSQIRGYFPQTQSCMMDFDTFNAFKDLAITGIDTTVTEIIAPPIPCKILAKISMAVFIAVPHKAADTVKINITHKRSFLRPNISANLPKGKINIAVANEKERAIQFSTTVLINNSLLTEGNATLTADVINGTTKAPRVVTVITTFLFIFLSNCYHSPDM
jgi:hypothetical protein